MTSRTRARIDVADCIAWAEAYDGPPFHALLCDPPYHLTANKKGGTGEASLNLAHPAGRSRITTGGGFMGQQWDGGDLAHRPDTWRALARVLHPGAFGMAFASSRGWHRLAVAIEDAGLIIHPSIFGWAQGSGFPKATRVVVKCECERTLPKAQHDVPELRQTDISEAGQNGVSDRCDVLDGLQEQVVQEHGESPDEGSAGRPESGMERRGDVSETSRQLRVGKVCAVPARASTDGADGRIHHGASPCNGDVVRPSLDAGGDGAPCGPRPVEQPAVQPGIVADKCGPQEGRGGAVCSRCGKPLESSTVWLGHRYGLQALKPALEPIIVFQKPYAGRPAESIAATGAGALWIDGARVPTGDSLNGGTYSGDDYRAPYWTATDADPGAVPLSRLRNGSGREYRQPAGRWPANLVVCHTLECNGACAPGCPVAALGAQSGERASGGNNPAKSDIRGGRYGSTAGDSARVIIGDYGPPSTGTAARFYHNPDFALDIAERLAAAEPVRYVAKASRRERNAGCDDFAERAMNWSSGEQSPGTFQSDGTNRAARNPHPTVKPLALAQHLATLLLPPDAYAPRRLFVPFAGSGSECIGAMLAGWDEVVGVELSDEYADIARARLAWWEANRPAATQAALPLAEVAS